MVLRQSTRRALHHLGHDLRRVWLFAWLSACTVYDEAALGRKTSSVDVDVDADVTQT